MPSMAILIVCRNRRETTLAALRRVAGQDLTIPRTIVLFDDASSDGTVEAVLDEFPDVRIVRGDGNAFWNGGLHAVWQAALAEPVDAFLWLNDDVVLDADAFAHLAQAWRQLAQGKEPRFILAGATRGDDGAVSYGGMRHEKSPVALRFRAVAPTDQLQPVDTFNGNIVLVPRHVVKEIGINDPYFHHNLGDVDYGLRARAAGIPILLLPGTLGHCAANDTKRTKGYGAPGTSAIHNWRKVNTHHGLPFKSWWRMTRRHSGRWWPLHFILPYRWLVLPWRRR